MNPTFIKNQAIVNDISHAILSFHVSKLDCIINLLKSSGEENEAWLQQERLQQMKNDDQSDYPQLFQTVCIV